MEEKPGFFQATYYFSFTFLENLLYKCEINTSSSNYQYCFQVSVAVCDGRFFLFII